MPARSYACRGTVPLDEGLQSTLLVLNLPGRQGKMEIGGMADFEKEGALFANGNSVLHLGYVWCVLRLAVCTSQSGKLN